MELTGSTYRLWGSADVPKDQYYGSAGDTVLYELPQFSIPNSTPLIATFDGSPPGPRIFINNAAIPGGQDSTGNLIAWWLDTATSKGMVSIDIEGTKLCTNGVPAVEGTITATYVRCVGKYDRWTCDPPTADSAMHLSVTFAGKR